MKALRLLPSAQRDLDAIWNYTAAAWGIEQAETYIAALRWDMERLCEYPQLGPPHRSRVAEFRKLPSGHHLIFYLVRDQTVEVARILHERMDLTRQLGK